VTHLELELTGVVDLLEGGGSLKALTVKVILKNMGVKTWINKRRVRKKMRTFRVWEIKNLGAHSSQDSRVHSNIFKVLFIN